MWSRFRMREKAENVSAFVFDNEIIWKKETLANISNVKDTYTL